MLCSLVLVQFSVVDLSTGHYSVLQGSAVQFSIVHNTELEFIVGELCAVQCSFVIL